MLKEKHVKKYMRLAKQVGEDNNPCYSRHIGVVIIDPTGRKILGTGYNGPPRNCLNTDAHEYLEQIFWPQLDPIEKAKAANSVNCESHDDSVMCQSVCDKYTDSKTCPRKIIGAPSGKRLELCHCTHGESNAIVNAATDLYGAYMICYCGVPCIECSKLIINAGIKKIYAVGSGDNITLDYSYSSRWLLQQGGVEVEIHPMEYYMS